jgi:hypothetical protein
MAIAGPGLVSIWTTGESSEEEEREWMREFLALPAAIGAPEAGHVDVGALFETPLDALGFAGKIFGDLPTDPAIADDPDVCTDDAEVAGATESLVTGAAAASSVSRSVAGCVVMGEVAAGFVGNFAAGIDGAGVLLEAVTSKAERAVAGTDDVELAGAVDEIAVVDFAVTGSSAVCFAFLVASKSLMA